MTNFKNKITAGLALGLMTVFLCANVSADSVKQLWSLGGFEQPESVAFDPTTKALYISNMKGTPMELNGQGYISKVSPEGDLLEKKWLEGFDAPKGIAIQGDLMYVADLKQVHVVSVSERRIVHQYRRDDSTMLNDVAIATDGTVYVGDLLGGVIYRIKNGEMIDWFSDTHLPHPNGLLWHKGKLLVAGWGLVMAEDFTTKTPGSLYQLNTTSKKLKHRKGGDQMGNLDGIARIKNRLYISDWMTGGLFELQGKKRKKVLSLPAGLADIGAHGKLLYAPSMHLSLYHKYPAIYKLSGVY